MNIGQHFQIGFAIDNFPPLIAEAILPGRHAIVISSDKIPLVTSQTAPVGCLGDPMSRPPVAVVAAAQVAGIAVFPEKIRIRFANCPSDKEFFPASGGHGMIEQRAVFLVATDAARDTVHCR